MTAMQSSLVARSSSSSSISAAAARPGRVPIRPLAIIGAPRQRPALSTSTPTPTLRSPLLHQQQRRSSPSPSFVARASENDDDDDAKTTAVADPSSSSSSSSSSSKFTFIDNDKLPLGKPTFDEKTAGAKGATKFRLAFALPWRRFKSDSVLVLEVAGGIGEKRAGRFAPSALTMPQLTRALEKAAYDPRIKAVYLKIDILSVGWAKLQEISEYLELFNASGKSSIAFLERGGEKEYYLASACSKVFIAPSASLSLRGVGVAGTFLRGVFEKFGITPEIRRIGNYKSAGDQLLRKDMSPYQREQLQAIVDAVYAHFTETVAKRRGKTTREVEELLDAGVFENETFLKGGWVDGLLYEDEVINEVLRPAAGLEPERRAEVPPPGAAPKPKPEKTFASLFSPKSAEGKEKDGEPAKKPSKESQLPLRTVGLKKYAFVSPTAFGLVTSRKRIAVVRASGAIVGGSAGGDGQITAGPLVKTLEFLGKDPRISAVVIRVDSPGGDALASDLVWRAVRNLSARKPVVASMGDVAASGGYYIPMAASKIVAQPLTITGSIGVVTGKLVLGGDEEEIRRVAGKTATTVASSSASAAAPGGLAALFGGGSRGEQEQQPSTSSTSSNSSFFADPSLSLYSRVGYAKTLISKGKYADLFTEARPFRPEEAELFDASAAHAYASFRDKAALSRGKTAEEMQRHAQGRVWTGQDALDRGLVDALGGISRAIAIASELAGVPEGERAGILEVSRATTSPLSLVTGGGGASVSSSNPVEVAAALLRVFSAVAAAASGRSGSAGALAAALSELGGVLNGNSSSSSNSVSTALALSDPTKPLYLMMDDFDVVGSSEL